MGHHGLKIDFSGIILGGFDPKITTPMSIRVRNLTFDQFLKIFRKVRKMRKNRPKIVLNRSKNKDLDASIFYVPWRPGVRFYQGSSSRYKI